MHRLHLVLLLATSITIAACAEPDGVPPVAVDDTGTVANTTMLDLDVLANDDLGGSTGSISIIEPPLHGEATASGLPGHILYSPDSTYVGTDLLRYQVLNTDGGADQADVTLTVLAPAE